MSLVKERKKMANIGTTTAFYKVETSLSRANSEVSKSMERLATGKQNANAGDRSSYVAMADTFRMDFVGNKGRYQRWLGCDGIPGNRYARVWTAASALTFQIARTCSSWCE